jgi:hypothetical protein
MDKHVPSFETTGALKVMADLRGSDCLSMEECTSVFKSYYQWERRLVKKTAVKESDIIKKVASIMDKHEKLLPVGKETGGKNCSERK